ncbi:uncharacterized protein DUF4402 [Novosphingobium sp. PhB165]|uniref:DUF4402 domain-containing protein n=1 Tax=Novosphingobium sp. PhB165 TaxID=2485105 RepID=UPI0010EF7624|nr:DUF4402 domain-containing protein [Novosphingobium sp. PhB165]TCM19788.1 uncharacterized protein DUF4402 [Novosphingobium sp. PhB165]
MSRSPVLPVAAGLLAAGALVEGAPALAADGVAEGGTHAAGVASATVVDPLSVRALSDLDFGSVGDVGAQGGSLMVLPGGGEARYAGAAHSACPAAEAECAAPHAARLRVEGQPGRAYRVVVPESVLAHAADTAAEMPTLPVTGLTVRTDSRPQAGAQGVLDEAGGDGFEIGGELRIPPGTEASHYRAQVPVIVVYG